MFEFLSKLRVSRYVPQALADGLLAPKRGNRYGESCTQASPPTAHPYADDGSYMVATNPTIGVGMLFVAAQIAFSDTAPNLYIYNGDDPSDPEGHTIFLHFLKLIATAAATAATAIHYAFILDKAQRATTLPNMTAITPVSPGSARGTPLSFGPIGSGNSMFYFQNSATVSAIAASSASRRIVGRGCLGGLNIAGDELAIVFGATDVGAQSATTAVEGAGQPGRRVSFEAPVGIPPGWSLSGHIWAPGSSASFNPEFVAGVWAR